MVSELSENIVSIISESLSVNCRDNFSVGFSNGVGDAVSETPVIPLKLIRQDENDLFSRATKILKSGWIFQRVLQRIKSNCRRKTPKNGKKSRPIFVGYRSTKCASVNSFPFMKFNWPQNEES